MLKFIKRLIITILFFLFGFYLGSISVSADSFTAYDGNINSTYINYFRDVDLGFFDDYVVWRDDDYSYKMFVSNDLNVDGSAIVGGTGTVYEIYLSGNYNNTLRYRHYDINNFSLTNSNHYIIYSSIGTYPKLERGLRYDKITLFTIFTACLFVLIGIIYKCINIKPFGSRK